MVSSLGADHTIDYGAEDFRTNGLRYDVIFDAVGKLKRSSCSASLSSGGRWTSVRGITKEVPEELRYVQELVAKGEVKPFIDREFPLAEVAAAHRYVETGRKRGNVVIRI